MRVSRQQFAFIGLGLVLAIGILLWAIDILPSSLWLLPIALVMVVTYPVRRISRGK